MNVLNTLKQYPLMTVLFLVSFVVLTLIFILGIYKVALIILLSLIMGAVGYFLDRSQLLNR